MKNIHLLPTDKFQNIKLSLFENKLYLGDIASTALPQHIYITSDEEIKAGDWFIGLKYNKIFKTVLLESGKIRSYYYTHLPIECKKIILTTDQELIKDGVQAIDDEFLEWFVRIPNCEEVCIKRVANGVANHKLTYEYKIIIPKEEPKQETLENYVLDSNEHNNLKSDDGTYLNFHKQSELLLKGAKLGAKWQKERMYNDLVDLLNFVSKEYNIGNGIGWFYSHESIEEISSVEVLKKWFEQFKNK